MVENPTPRPTGFAATAASAPTAPVAPVRLPRPGTARGDAHARRILDGLPVPVLSLLVPHGPEQQTRVTWINRAAEEVLGRSAEDLIREPASLWGHVHADDVATLREWLANPTEQPLFATIRFVTLEGRLRRYDLVAQPRSEDQGPGTTAVDVVLHDVSSRVDLQQAVEDREQQIKALAESSRDVVFHLRLHPQLTVAWTNDAAPNLLGLSPAELHEDASALFRTVFPEHRNRLREALQAAVGGPTTTTFDINRHGQRVTVEMDLRPVRSAGQTALLAVGRRVGESGPLHAAPEASVVTAPAARRAPTSAPVATPAMTPAGIWAQELEAAGLARIDVGALMRQVVRDVSLVGRTVELQLEKAPLQADVVFLRPALEAAVDNVRTHTPEGTNVRIVVARTSAGVLVSIADDGPGHAWPEGHRANAKGIADLADAGLGSGDGFRAMAMAADRHTGRAAMQSAPGAGTTVRLLLHDAQPLVDDDTIGQAEGVTIATVGTTPSAAVAIPAQLVTLGHDPAFRDEPLEALAPRFIEVEA